MRMEFTVTGPRPAVLRDPRWSGWERGDAAGARDDLGRPEDGLPFSVKEGFYGFLATERRRDAVNTRIRAAERRTRVGPCNQATRHANRNLERPSQRDTAMKPRACLVRQAMVHRAPGMTN